MGLRPTYSVVAEGEPLTAALAGRSTSITIEDVSGVIADKLTIQLADKGGELAIPRKGVYLDVALGYDDINTSMGRFIVDDVSLSGWPLRMTITGTGAPLAPDGKTYTPIQTYKSRVFSDTTIGEIVETMANDCGLVNGCDRELGSIGLSHVEQICESDISLLTRIAARVDAIAKPSGGKLLFIPKGSVQTASGADIPTVLIGAGAMVSFDWRNPCIAKVSQVEASYRDMDFATTHIVTVGKGPIVKQLNYVFANKSEAESRAKAELNQARRAGAEVTFTAVGNAAMAVGTPLELTGIRSSVDGKYRVVSVTHTLSEGGYQMAVKATAEVVL
ncbi:hypothetical protein EDC56_1249 [Sinobacterium caligoides]|uniref:Phage protein D n=1 Tax=Sinobacterium caligoides TaxID=933926 RepID=A0A3N2E0R5_9GAMM|nr:contractile injection system protein, VgrG/Pvc8 family [Sinobacterium caligoides]ROS05700.1 hypothetical protein EDC56_1249 [Sinobacterium caligoides]